MFSLQALSSCTNDLPLQMFVEQTTINGQNTGIFGVESGFNPTYQPVFYQKNRLNSTESGYNTSCCNSEVDGPVVNIENEIFKQLQMNHQIPYRNYICHRCFGKDHLFQHCPQRDPSPKSPYQRNNISKGAFRCKCGRTWKSEFVIANKSYNCHTCQAPNFPVKMWKKYNENIHGKGNRFRVPKPSYNNTPSQPVDFFYTCRRPARHSFTEIVNATITLKNPSDRAVCFKIKTTVPKLYCVRPNAGVILSGQSKQIAVMLQPLENDISGAGHKFMVQSCYAPDEGFDVDLENVWKNIESSKLMSTKLFVTFEAANKEPATVKYLWSPEPTPTTKKNDSASSAVLYSAGSSADDLETQLRSEMELRKKAEIEKSSLSKDIQELFKKNARLHEDYERIITEMGIAPIQVILAAIAALLLGLIIGRLF